MPCRLAARAAARLRPPPPRRACLHTIAAMSTSTDPASTHPDLYPHGMASLTASTHPACAAPAILARLGAPSLPTPLPPAGSAFVRPLSLAYTLDGASKRWDMVRAHASVACLLFHAGLRSVLLVRQFRPAVWECVRSEGLAATPPASTPPPPLAAGFTYELCAGILDKPALPPAAVAAEEVAEECGFRVDPSALEVVARFRTAIGISGAPHTIFYAAVTEADRLPAAPGVGGGVEGEAIETLALPVDRVDAFLADPALARSAGLMYALAWLKARLRDGGA